MFARSVAIAPWGLRLPGTIQLAVHAVVQGHAWLWTEDGENPVELTPGDLAFARGGPDHFVACEPTQRGDVIDPGIPNRLHQGPAFRKSHSVPVSCAVGHHDPRVHRLGTLV
jgi:hypothetical protein